MMLIKLKIFCFKALSVLGSNVGSAGIINYHFHTSHNVLVAQLVLVG